MSQIKRIRHTDTSQNKFDTEKPIKSKSKPELYKQKICKGKT